MQSKPFWESKTVWTNVIVAILMALVFIGEGITSGELNLPIEADGAVIVFLVNAANVALRMITKQPIRAK